MGTFQASGMFHGVQFCIDFAAFSNLSFKRKQQIRGDIVNNGGILSYILTKQTNYLVTSNSERTLTSHKGRTAQKYGIAVVSCEFLTECIKAGQLLDPQPYLLSETKESQSFCSGKITTKSQTHQKKAKAVKFVHLPDIKKLRAWPYKSADAPVFDEQNFEIAKDVLFQGFDSSGSVSSFYALELHVIPSQRPCNGFRYRLFSHSGNLKGLQEGDEGIKECRYCNTLGEALGAYTVFYSQQTQAPYNMTRVESVLSHSIGSDKIIQMKISDYCHEEDVILSPDVANLVEVLWNEATGSLSDILAVPVNTIKLEDVEKAEGILLLLKRSFDNVEDASKVKELSDEFFSIIPHKSKTLEIASRQEIARKQDLCQLIKDMVNISESTNWQARRSVYSKYRSLKCHIECLQHESDEFQSIQECVNSSESGLFKINILNIFSIRRPVEDATFSHEIENKKLLFHSSKVTNFVGILSRGLLLPKIVVDDFGGTRSDAGMLGSGIYFASSASTSAKYSAPGNHGTRLMLVNEVALGNIKAFRKFALDLTSPPYGYNSCHGVQGTEDEPSDFKDDEFVIYNGNQQKIRYLVEFVLPDDKVIPRDDVSLDSGFSDEEMEVDEEESSVELSDVMSVVDPLSKIEAGLKGSGDKVIPLQSVHIRARLLDLAAQVVVFQAYKNSSSTPIEAKYVFPLDDVAAVCGFEAFINNKHIVGEVKEKEQAHKEYREAISQGHGAYLMDEETPDVFTVSVGNLPPGSQVLIKITYVTELLVDGEHICFSLPGSLAPWKRSKALEEITQTDVYSVPIEEEQLRDLKDFSVNVCIEMPFEIRSIDSPTHPIGIKRSATKAVVVVEPGQSMENGFQLLIGLAEIHVPRMWVERHTNKPDSQACMLAFYPEFESESPQVVEVLFLVDVSCSMKGSPIEEAKKILLLCLTHMNRDWIFNIILFGSKNSELFPCSRRKDEAFGEAKKFIKALKANKGSTELWRVLQKLSLLPAISTADHPRNLFLISDGHVTEEETSLNFIRKNCQSDRMFTFGVGSTANRYLLRFMAKAGAGASEFFDSKAKSKWERKVTSQLSKAEQPSLTSVEISWQQHDSGSSPPIQAPTQLLSTFSGSRQVVYGFVDNCTQASLSAEVDGKRLSTIVSTTDLNVTTGKILHQLTAKAVIRDWDEGSLHEKRTGHEVEKRNRKEYIISISKEFSVTSKFTSFVAIELREKDEKFEEGKGPSIQDLLKEEVVDILPYIGWEEKIEDKQKREQTTEEWLEEQLKKARVLETCAVLRCERLYQDVLKKARDKLGPNHKLSYDAAFSLFNFYLNVMGDKDRASLVFEETDLVDYSATADHDPFVVCKSVEASEEETSCEEETSSEEEVSCSEEDSFGEDYEKPERIKNDETFECPKKDEEIEWEGHYVRMVWRKDLPNLTQGQEDSAEEQYEEAIKDDSKKYSLLLDGDDCSDDSDGGSVCFAGPSGEGDSSLQNTPTRHTFLQQEMGEGLSRNVVKGVTANLEGEKGSLDFQIESALPLTSNNIIVAQGFSCEGTTGSLFGGRKERVPDLRAARKKKIPPFPQMRATTSSLPPAYERAASPPPPPSTPPLPPRNKTRDEWKEGCGRTVLWRDPSETQVQEDSAEKQWLPLRSDDCFGDSDGGSVCFDGPIGEGDSSLQDTPTRPTQAILQQERSLFERVKSRVQSTYESVHEELGVELSEIVFKGDRMTANLKEEESLDFQIESALPLTSNDINVAQGFSREGTSGLFGKERVPDLPTPRGIMIPPLLATTSSLPPAYERAASPPPLPPPVYGRGVTPPTPRRAPAVPLRRAKTSSIPPACASRHASRPPPSAIPTSSLLSAPEAYCMSRRSPARESERMTLPRDRRKRVEKSVLHLEKPDGVYYRKARLARVPMEKIEAKTTVPPPGVEQDTTAKIRQLVTPCSTFFSAPQKGLRSPLQAELGGSWHKKHPTSIYSLPIGPSSGINDGTSREEKGRTRIASEMQYYSNSSKRMKLKEIFNKQKADGFWDTNDLTIIGANKNGFLDFLGNAGAKSLGPRIFEGVQRLLSTLLVLAFIKFRLSIDVPLSLPLGDTVGKVIFSRLVELYSKRIIQALKWIKEQEKTMPSMYTRLEFGANWEAACEKILQEMCA